MVDANGCNGEDGDGEDESDDDTTTVGAVALIVCVEEGVHSRMSVGIFLTCTKPDMFRYSWLSDMMIRLNKIYLFIYQFNCRVKAIAVGERGKRETRQDGKGQDWKVIKTAWNRLSRWCLYS